MGLAIYPAFLAYDPATGQAVPGVAATVTDPLTGIPLETLDLATGQPRQIFTNHKGHVEGFMVEDGPGVALVKVGSYGQGVPDLTMSVDIRDAALQAAQAAIDAANLVGAPADEVVALLISGEASQSSDAFIQKLAANASTAEGLIPAAEKDRLFGRTPLGNEDLNTLVTPGGYNQSSIAAVTVYNHYPISGSSCDVDVKPYSTVEGQVTQIVTYAINGRRFHRRTTNGGQSWTDFIEYARVTDADNATRSYSAPYSYSLPISDEVNFENYPGAGLQVIRTADTIQVVGIIRAKTSGYINTSTARKFAQLPPDAIPFTDRQKFSYHQSDGAEYRLQVTPTGSLSIRNHTSGTAGLQISIDLWFATHPKPATNFGQFFGKFYEGTEYQVESSVGANTEISSIAIHGGEIEPGSEECARELADLLGCSMYAFDAMLPSTRGGSTWEQLHASSNGFDDPRALAVVQPSQRCVSFHGAADGNYGMTGAVTFVGGLDVELRTAVADALRSAGFIALDDPATFPLLAGTHPTNICNQTARRAGVQLEMSTALRRSFFAGGDAGRPNRGNTTPTFDAYMVAVQSAVESVVG